MGIVSCQDFDGSFSLNEFLVKCFSSMSLSQLKNLLNNSCNELNTQLSINKEIILVTVLIIVIFQKMNEWKDEWEMLISKAKKWLNSKVSNLSPQLIQWGNQFIQSNSFIF